MSSIISRDDGDGTFNYVAEIKNCNIEFDDEPDISIVEYVPTEGAPAAIVGNVVRVERRDGSIDVGTVLRMDQLDNGVMRALVSWRP